jgi:phenylacetate-CoA ligase
MFLFDSPLYRVSPIWLQEAAIHAVMSLRRQMREGTKFQEIRNAIERTQWLRADALREYQQAHVRATLQNAAADVPFYRQRFAQAGIQIDSHTGIETLGQIPALNKRDVMAAGKTILSQNAQGPRFKGATSGTTGLSMIGYRDLRSINYENAFLARQLSWAGYKPGDRRAWLRGDMVAPASQMEPPYWRRNRADNSLMLSSFHLSEKNAPLYIDALERFDPEIIQAYPSSIAFLARYLESQDKYYAGKNLRGIVTSSETVLEEQRKVIEKAMGCRLFDWYGSFERVVAIGTCEHGQYHLLSDYSFVELIPHEDGSTELVGTSFYNDLMPFIRFRIGDAVMPEPAGFQCPCGREFPAIRSIRGRMDDYVVTPDGRQIAMMANMFDGVDYLLEAQIIQDQRDELQVLLVPVRQMKDEDYKDLEHRARLLVGNDMRITYSIVDEIPRTRAGKLRVVVRNI